MGTTVGAFKGDTRSFDYSSYDNKMVRIVRYGLGYRNPLLDKGQEHCLRASCS